MKAMRRTKSKILVAYFAALTLAGGMALAAGQANDSPEAVKNRVVEKFKQSGLLVGNDIQVAVENKTITLTGTVRNLALKEQAGREALSVAKGFKLANNIALAETGLSIQQIAEAVMAAIEKSPSYYIFDYVGVSVTDDGAVTLKGWTTYPWSATDLVKLAQAQPGVQKVTNEIRRILSTDADQALRLVVARLIYTRPKTSSFSRMSGSVHILVNNGVVTLGGTVDREADIEGFERLVRFNTNAVNVVNALQVRKEE
jgi:osmotically-inducible protein OsmY